MLSPCGLRCGTYICSKNPLFVLMKQKKTKVVIETTFVIHDIAVLLIWQMLLLEPSPRVIDFDDVSSQYEGIEL